MSMVVLSPSNRDRHGRGNRPLDDDGGYTLLELLVVLAILALLAGLVAPRMMGYLSSSKSQTARLQISNLVTSVELFRLDMGRYPTKEEGLSALINRPSNGRRWNGPYLSNEGGILDPWDRPYSYQYPGEHGEFDIFSLGADGKKGGEEEDRDINGWERVP